MTPEQTPTPQRPELWLPIYVAYYSHAKCDCYKIDLPWPRYGKQTIVLCPIADGMEKARREAKKAIAEHLDEIWPTAPIPAPSPVAPKATMTNYKEGFPYVCVNCGNYKGSHSETGMSCPVEIGDKAKQALTPPEAPKATPESYGTDRIWVSYDEDGWPVETEDRDAKTHVEYIRVDQVEALRTWIRKLEAVITITHAEYEKLLPELAALKAKE